MADPIAKLPAEILGKKTLRLGFGSSQLLWRDRREALRLLETAIDCGITYFDTARMYCGGESEGILGEVVSRHRQRLILASKAGILPTTSSILARGATKSIRLIHKIAPRTKSYLPVPRAEYRFGAFDLVDVRKSIETSLRKLRTDYLDVFLLHECAEAHIGRPELISYLNDLKIEGKVRALGIATGIDETVHILQGTPGLLDVVQIPNSVFDMNIRRISDFSRDITVTHSALASGFKQLVDRLSQDDATAAEWRVLTKVDPRSPTNVAQLLVAYALRANPGGIVLFFSANPKNIAENVKLLNGSAIDDSQIDGLETFLAKGLLDATRVHDLSRA
jgi:D-threo-aldose 1-dehydrogenase